MRYEKRVTAMKEPEPLAPCYQTVCLLCMLSCRSGVWFCISIPEFHIKHAVSRYQEWGNVPDKTRNEFHAKDPTIAKRYRPCCGSRIRVDLPHTYPGAWLSFTPSSAPSGASL